MQVVLRELENTQARHPSHWVAPNAAGLCPECATDTLSVLSGAGCPVLGQLAN